MSIPSNEGDGHSLELGGHGPTRGGCAMERWHSELHVLLLPSMPEHHAA